MGWSLHKAATDHPLPEREPALSLEKKSILKRMGQDKDKDNDNDNDNDVALCIGAWAWAPKGCERSLRKELLLEQN